MSEQEYVVYTCKHCKKAFLDKDYYNYDGETPLKDRYCPECVELGYKNKRVSKKVLLEIQRKQELDNFLVENNITEYKDIKFVQKKFHEIIEKNTTLGKRVIVKNILKSCLELLSYQDWKASA